MPVTTRRNALTVAGILGGLTVGGTTAAAAEDPPEWAVDHITSVGDDPAELRKYEPYLDIPWSDQQSLIGVYGWYADSSEFDTRAYYYWAKYAKQDSLTDSIPVLGPLLSLDSHFKDHEPVAVFADTDTGEVTDVIYSGYHHFGVRLTGEEMTLVQDETDRPTHPSLQVAVPHHHYRHQRDETKGVPAHTISGAEFGSFLEQRSVWDQNNVFASSHEPAVNDPWLAKSRGTWWAKDTWDYQFARIRILLNWRDGGEDLITES
ncbi:hypothetical protein [Natrinema thermotolerans]|uniref:hypothetical protein n=1 Tax=Natrinema thermotolerans TaxID=121872 RepID=UPI0006795F60|nr:hypothetical protein [Natrinema thermotolerans]